MGQKPQILENLSKLSNQLREAANMVQEIRGQVAALKEPKPKQPRDKLVVTFPDGTIIRHNQVVQTFTETISRIGVDRVRELKLTCVGAPLVSLEKDLRPISQHKCGEYWVITNTSTFHKRELLEEINRRLRAGITVAVEYPEDS